MGASSEDEADRLRRVISGLLQIMGKVDLERVLAVAQRIRARRDVPDPPRSAPALFRGREGGETVVEWGNAMRNGSSDKRYDRCFMR